MTTLKEYVETVLRDIREGAYGHVQIGSDRPKVKFRVGVSHKNNATEITGESHAGAGTVEFELPLAPPQAPERK